MQIAIDWVTGWSSHNYEFVWLWRWLNAQSSSSKHPTQGASYALCDHFTEKVNAGSMEASSNVGGKVSRLDCALEIGD